MAAPGGTREARRTGCYVYGIVPGDVEPVPGARGLRDAPVELVREGDLAALVTRIEVDEPLGTPEDLTGHERLLDATAAEVPVLPMRFGAVLTDTDAVAGELLAANYEAFRAALDELEGRVEYLVRGRYVEKALLGEVLAESGEAARLRDAMRGRPEEATRDVRIRLGELIHHAIAAKRDADTARLVAALSPHAVANVVREPTHDEDAVHVAFLVETERRSAFEDALNELVRDWEGRVTVRLLGPLAPYDFVITPRPGG